MKVLSLFQTETVSGGRYEEFFTDEFNEDEEAFEVSFDLPADFTSEDVLALYNLA
jgi:hypothetical protein